MDSLSAVGRPTQTYSPLIISHVISIEDPMKAGPWHPIVAITPFTLNSPFHVSPPLKNNPKPHGNSVVIFSGHPILGFTENKC